MPIKLYSYGDSHAAGHELGSASDLGKAWLKEHYGVEHRDHLDPTVYHKIVRPAWIKYIKDNKCNPTLSYAGQLAKMIDAELVDRAIPGSSNDWSAMRLLEDLSRITADDIVLFSICTPARFLSGKGEDEVRTQIHWQPMKVQRILYEYGPHDNSFNIWNQGLIHLISNITHDPIIIKTNDDSIEVKGQDTTYNLLFTETSFTQFAFNKAGHDDIRYPAGHIHEDYHKLYAEYLCQRM